MGDNDQGYDSQGYESLGDLLRPVFSPLDDPDGTKAQLAQLRAGSQGGQFQMPGTYQMDPTRPSSGSASDSPPPAPGSDTANVAPDPKSTWGRYAQQAIEGQARNAAAAENTTNQLASQPDEATALGPLLKQRLAAAAPIDPQAQQYRPTLGQRIFRGIQSGVNGLARGGVIGAAAGALDANYQAPNRQYAIDTQKQQQTVGGLDSNIAASQKAYEDATARAKGIAALQKDVGASYNEMGQRATGEETEQNTAARDAEIARHNQADEGNTATRNQTQATNEQQERKQEDRRIGLESSRVGLEWQKFKQEQQAQGDNDQRRQPYIDRATQQVKDLEDQYTYDPDRNNYKNNKTKARISPQEFTDMKNDIGTKLDQELDQKKLKPLGVRFDVNDAMGAQYRKGGASGTPAAQQPQGGAPAPKQQAGPKIKTAGTGQQIGVGDTVMYKGQSRVVAAVDPKSGKITKFQP